MTTSCNKNCYSNIISPSTRLQWLWNAHDKMTSAWIWHSHSRSRSSTMFLSNLSIQIGWFTTFPTESLVLLTQLYLVNLVQLSLFCLFRWWFSMVWMTSPRGYNDSSTSNVRPIKSPFIKSHSHGTVLNLHRVCK